MSEWDHFDSFLNEQDKAEADTAEKDVADQAGATRQRGISQADTRTWMEQTARPALEEIARRFHDRGQGWEASLTPAAGDAPPPAQDASADHWVELAVSKDGEPRFTYRLEAQELKGSTRLKKFITGYDPVTGAIRNTLGWGKFRSANAREDPTAITRDEIMTDFREDFEFRMTRIRRPS